MPWSGGIFHRIHNWISDAAADINIMADRMDAEFDNFKAGLQNCLTRDNQTPPTGNMSMGGFKITDLGPGTATTDAANVGQLTAANGLSSGTNFLDNGGLEIFSLPGRSIYPKPEWPAYPVAILADRWWGQVLDTGSFARAGIGGALTGGGLPNRFEMGRGLGSTGTQAIRIGQSSGTPETTPEMDLADLIVWTLEPRTPGLGTQHLVFSLFGYRGANFSGAGVLLEVLINGRDLNIHGEDWSVEASYFIPVSLISTAYQRFSVSTTQILTDTHRAVGVRVSYVPSGTAGAEDAFYFTGCKLELTNSAVPSSYLIPTLQEALERCRRFYQAFYGGDASWVPFAGYGGAGQVQFQQFLLPTPMIRKGRPTVVTSGISLMNCSLPSIVNITQKSFAISTTVTALGAFNYYPLTNSYFTFDCEAIQMSP